MVSLLFTSAVLCPDLANTIRERYGQTREGPKEGHEDMAMKTKGLRTCPIKGTVKGLGPSFPKSHGGILSATKRTEALHKESHGEDMGQRI